MERIKEELCSDVIGVLATDPDFESLSKDKQKKVEAKCRKMVNYHLDMLSNWIVYGLREEVMKEKEAE